MVKLNKNKMKKVLKTLGLQHRRDILLVEIAFMQKVLQFGYPVGPMFA
jgi:hypothetical protein